MDHMPYFLEIFGAPGPFERLKNLLLGFGATRARDDFSHPTVDEAEILRLTETAPYLMKDIGFHEVREGVWSNGGTEVVVRGETAVDRLLRAGRI